MVWMTSRNSTRPVEGLSEHYHCKIVWKRKLRKAECGINRTTDIQWQTLRPTNNKADFPAF